MTVKYLKELIADMPDDRQIFVVGYNNATGETVIRYTERCCNLEYQEENNVLWLSSEGLIKR